MAKRYKFSQDGEEIQWLLNKIDGLQVNQPCMCGTDCELENIELNDVVYSVITRAVNNLLNYYTKSETFTRSEIDSKISAIHQFSIKQVDVLPRPSAQTTYTLYLVPSSEQRADNVTDEFITVYRNGSYVWEQVGTSPVDLSHYVTDSQLNSVLSGYVTSQAFSSAVTNLSNRIDGLHEVKYTMQNLTDGQKSRARSNIGAGTYSKPSSGIPASDLANGVIPDVSQFITKTVNDLANYYTKSQTYTKQEVRALIGGSVGFTYVLASSLPEPSIDTMWKMYLIPSDEPKVANEKDEFITIDNGSSANPRYTWEQIGSTAIDLSGYVTTEALNTALADYVTSDALATALAGLNDVKYTPQSLTAEQKLQARTNIGATAPELFWAVYGETTFEEVTNAIASGKEIAVAWNNTIVLFSGKVGDNYYFASPNGTQSFRYYILNPQDAWSGGTVTLEQSTRKVSTIVGHEAETDKYPNTKAVADAITAGKQIFWAEYGVTTTQEVEDAISANKLIALVSQDRVYLYTSKTSQGSYTFDLVESGRIYRIVLASNGTWSSTYFNVEFISNKSQSIETDKDSTTKYPSTKAVADALQIFPVTYEVTTIADIQAAVTAGKTPVCIKEKVVYVYVIEETNAIIFAAVNLANVKYIRITKSTNVWYNGSIVLENSANKTSDVANNPANTTKYVTPKGVYDALPIAMTDAQLDTLFDANWQ